MNYIFTLLSVHMYLVPYFFSTQGQKSNILTFLIIWVKFWGWSGLSGSTVGCIMYWVTLTVRVFSLLQGVRRAEPHLSLLFAPWISNLYFRVSFWLNTVLQIKFKFRIIFLKILKSICQRIKQFEDWSDQIPLWYKHCFSDKDCLVPSIWDPLWIFSPYSWQIYRHEYISSLALLAGLLGLVFIVEEP